MTEQVYTLSDTEKQKLVDSPLIVRKRPVVTNRLYNEIIAGLPVGELVSYKWVHGKAKEKGITTHKRNIEQQLIEVGYLERTDHRGIYRVTGEKPL